MAEQFVRLGKSHRSILNVQTGDHQPNNTASLLGANVKHCGAPSFDIILPSIASGRWKSAEVIAIAPRIVIVIPDDPSLAVSLREVDRGDAWGDTC